MITAIALTAIVALVTVTAGAVRADGHGSRPAPRSHHDPFPVR